MLRWIGLDLGQKNNICRGLDWIGSANRWIGLDWISKNGPMHNSAINEAVVQKNCVKTLYRHGKPLEEKLALSDLAGDRTHSASQLRQLLLLLLLLTKY